MRHAKSVKPIEPTNFANIHKPIGYFLDKRDFLDKPENFANKSKGASPNTTEDYLESQLRRWWIVSYIEIED